ncbi:hypothetical protein M409DRAFT_28292 [Zasmidium cellare ATCC 36951]|uniref:Tat pathway signal sequence n=1 Tax=Zasmidium cellare ATCC 36951 TaxID=1080233 RepID=A0A6A6C2T9_ZASCE|nr:uncharacterized protein M409DRAFT_28292 [Zasmidium cellare ATCC 36951]KAF2161253.1 hypothetical protein M409DRAFT_28292 [Zasmidium cellare ATCC 36951]
MPGEERKKVRFGDDQILPESERRLLEDEEEKLFTDQHRAAPARVVGCTSIRAIVLIQTGLIILLLGTLVIGLVFRDERLPARCAAYLNNGTPMSTAVQYQERQRDASTRHHSRWRGPPSHEIDEAWHDIARENLILVTDDEVRAAGKDPARVVRLPPQYEHRYGPGALTLTQYGVELSCLNWIRMYIHADYYREHDDFHIFEQNSDETLRLKLDHCVEVLRDSLMCNAGTSIITHQWIQDRPRMFQDLHFPEKTCKDFDALVRWTKEREVEEMTHPVKDVIFGHHNPVQPQPTEYVYSHIP